MNFEYKIIIHAIVNIDIYAILLIHTYSSYS